MPEFTCEVKKELFIDYVPEYLHDELNGKEFHLIFKIGGFWDDGDYDNPPESGWHIEETFCMENGTIVDRWNWMTQEIEDILIDKIQWSDFDTEN